MSKTKFSINKETLIEEESNGYILTRVPRSKMEYYWLLNEKDVLSSDDKTLIVECDAEQDIAVLPRVKDGDGIRRPTLQEAIEQMNQPILVQAQELYNDYYEYDESKDPKQREEQQRIREQKRQEALERMDVSKNSQNQAKQLSQKQKDNNINTSRGQVSNQPQTPAQKMQQQRETIPHYSKQQFKEILKGTRQRLDTSLYSNIKLNPQQMKELRLSMKAGVDVTKYNSPFISAKHMKEIRLGAKRGVKFDMDKLDHSLYNAEQIHELRLGFEKKLDVKKYLDPSYEAGQMKELRLAMQAGLDTKRLEDFHLSVEQMHAIRHQMVLSNLGDILTRFFERMKEMVGDFVLSGMEKVSANLMNRESRTLEEMKEANMQEAIQDIKYTLVESDILPTRAYEDKGIDSKIREQIDDLVSYMDNEPEADIQKAAEETAVDMCQAVGAEINIPRDEKVVSINQSNNQVNNVVSAEQMNAISNAIDEQLGQATENTQEVVIAEDNFDMMQ